MWATVDLTPARGPELQPKESVLVEANNVSLYNRDEKLSVTGQLILTQTRLIYITKDPLKQSFQANVSDIGEISYIPPKFMRANSKITVKLKHTRTQGSWTCEICFFTNKAQSVICETCGVKPARPPELRNTSSLNGVCPSCTFHNHASLQYCEMCLSPLKAFKINLSRHVKFGLADLQGKALFDSVNQLQANLQPSTSQSPSFGINALRNAQKQTNILEINLLEEVVASPTKFQQHHSEIAAIAAKFNLSKPTLLVTGSHKDPDSIARQLADLLIGQDVLQSFGGMLTLHDLYKVYNRSRGLDLVSPQELLSATNAFERLGLPLKSRELGRIRIVEARGSLDRSLLKLVAHISQTAGWRQSCGFSAREISEEFGYSLQISIEQLQIAESRGLLCRDEHVSGLRFFANLFI